MKLEMSYLGYSYSEANTYKRKWKKIIKQRYMKSKANTMFINDEKNLFGILFCSPSSELYSS